MDLVFKILSILTAVTLIYFAVSHSKQEKRITALEEEAKEDRAILREHIKWGEERSQKILDGVEKITARFE